MKRVPKAAPPKKASTWAFGDPTDSGETIDKRLIASQSEKAGAVSSASSSVCKLEPEQSEPATLSASSSCLSEEG